jgi:hypothetical protein
LALSLPVVNTSARPRVKALSKWEGFAKKETFDSGRDFKTTATCSAVASLPPD